MINNDWRETVVFISDGCCFPGPKYICYMRDLHISRLITFGLIRIPPSLTAWIGYFILLFDKIISKIIVHSTCVTIIWYADRRTVSTFEHCITYTSFNEWTKRFPWNFEVYPFKFHTQSLAHTFEVYNLYKGEIFRALRFKDYKWLGLFHLNAFPYITPASTAVSKLFTVPTYKLLLSLRPFDMFTGLLFQINYIY